MTTELHRIFLDPDEHQDRVRELVEAYGAETIFENGEYDEDCLRAKIRLAAGEILSALCNGQLRIFRAISVEADWSPTWLGRHWTTSLHHAYPHDGNGESYVVVEADVDPDAINIHRSILLNMLNVDFSEAEILVRDDAELAIISIRSNSGQAAFEHLWGTKLRAIPKTGRPTDNSWRPPMTGKVFGS